MFSNYVYHIKKAEAIVTNHHLYEGAVHPYPLSSIEIVVENNSSKSRGSHGTDHAGRMKALLFLVLLAALTYVASPTLSKSI